MHSSKSISSSEMTSSRGREVVEYWMNNSGLAFLFKRAFRVSKKRVIASEIDVLSRWGREAGS